MSELPPTPAGERRVYSEGAGTYLERRISALEDKLDSTSACLQEFMQTCTESIRREVISIVSTHAETEERIAEARIGAIVDKIEGITAESRERGATSLAAINSLHRTFNRTITAGALALAGGLGYIAQVLFTNGELIMHIVRLAEAQK